MRPAGRVCADTVKLGAGDWVLAAGGSGVRLGVLLLAFPLGPPAPTAEAYLAGGCFWGVEAVFEHVRGVQSVTSGFAKYGDSGSVEAVRIVYDPSRIAYRQLLEVFFAVAHDPTSRDRQGPDIGPEYRAVVLFQVSAERETAGALVTEWDKSGRYKQPIVTEIRQLSKFTVAEALHQDYGARHPTDPYILRNDAPKLAHLRESFPGLYQERRSP